MKITFRLIFSLLLGTALVVLVFSYFQVQGEEKRLEEELRLRAGVLAKSFKGAVESFLGETTRPERVKKFIEGFEGHKRLIGVIVDLKETGRITLPLELAANELFREEMEETVRSEQAAESRGKWNHRDVYFYSVPLRKENEIAGSLGLIHDRSFISRRIREAWKQSAVTFSVLGLILSLTTLVLIRWNITGPIAKIAEWAKRARLGETPPSPSALTREKGEIERLAFEITHMASSLKAARLDLVERAREGHSHDSVWTKERLKEYLRSRLGESPLFVVANREPYIHRKKGSAIECIVPASGVVTALDPVLQATGGVWVAHGSGDADRETVNAEGKLLVPPASPSYSLKRIWLSPEEEKGYYYGFANEGLWPLCHITHTRPVFRIEDWKQYRAVNEKFRDALLGEFGKSAPYVLVQDYHFALLPKMIKEARPDAKVALFWHIPWPNPEAFGICPWQEEILQGMLASDLVGFHTQFHCNNFLDTVDRTLESRIDWTIFAVTREGKKSYVRPFPISIASPDTKKDQALEAEAKKLKVSLGLAGKKIGVGVDRIDYTKGLLERFKSIERTLEKYPEYQGKLVFVELGAPSRSLIPGYQSHEQEIEAMVQRVNAKFQSDHYQPILFLKDHHSQEKIKIFYRMADFCLVSSLHDGMNLVAKEFVEAREDEGGVLILSRFAGASQELASALLINPYDIEGTADAVRQSLEMPSKEKEERMKRMRSQVREHNVYRWAAELVTELVKN